MADYLKLARNLQFLGDVEKVADRGPLHMDDHNVEPEALLEPENAGLGAKLALHEQLAFPIVGVGASAGGLEALEQFFDHVPPQSGMAFVVVQHLSPDFKSLMDELLARHTSIPIRRVEDGMRVEPDAIYLIPPRKEMIISEGRLLLTDKDPAQGLHLPIDIFLRSLAQDVGTRAVAVILSGTGSDGSRGLRAVHEAGGLVVVQDEASARFNGMPKSAIETGLADLVLAPQVMGEALVSRMRGGDGAATEGGGLSPQIEVGLAAIFRGLREEYGIDFAHYKPTTVWRRIERRLAMGACRNIEEYAELIGQNPLERSALYKDLLIGVTRFFRDREAFERLEQDVIPQLLTRVREGGELRVWVAGCATGEEAYSLAVLIHERLSAMRRSLNVKIFATDVHRLSLEFASIGAYDETALSDVSPRRLERYFTRQGASLRVTPELRKLIVFAPHNIIKDAPFTKLDLISCRNMLIYLQPAAQQKACSLFHFGLNTGGILFLGPSENLGDLGDEFDTIDERWKIYRKRRDVRLPADLRLSLPPGVQRFGPALPIGTAGGGGRPDAQLLRVYDELLAGYVPPSLLVNERRELLHSFNGAGKYLSPRDGRASSDLLDLVDRDLKLALAGALQRAVKEQGPITFSGVRCTTPVGEKLLKVTVKPMANRGSENPSFLVMLEDLGEGPGESTAPDDWDAGQESSERMQTLEVELKYTKENLQATIEELETSNEELQATNEELVASNEELQSTNEELHSVNEELYTVNAEHQRKIVELSELTDDMDNLLRSTEIGTLFLDAELRIRKYTPAVQHSFSLLPQDIGRRIEDFSHTLDYPELPDDLRRVLNSGECLEREVKNRQGQWFLMRILPYQSEGKSREGVVVTFIDVSPLKQASETLRDNIASRSLAEEEAREAVVRRDQFLAMLSHELRNPLGAILAAADLLRRENASGDDLRKAREVVRRQSQQMANLLDDLLDVSRVTQGKIEIRPQVVDLRAILCDAVESVQPMFDERCQKLDIALGNSPRLVHGDPARLRQIHVNLLNNAAKYTPREGHIWLSLAAEGSEAVIRVRDTGAGIRPHLLQSVFDLFVQSNNTLDRSDGGMGVGLTLVRTLVEMHGGRVTAHSDGPGLGSEFVVRLPLTAQPATDAPRTDSLPQVGPLRVLIVEDNADSREMLRALLALEGHVVEEAADGSAGIASLRRDLPDIAFVDIGLPGLDGYQVARHAREVLPDNSTYLVALTGYGRPQDRRAVLDAGFDAHLVKPLKSDDLSRVLEQAAARLASRT